MSPFATPFCSLLHPASNNVYVWGLNAKGQLGLGDTRARYSPTLLERPSDASREEHVSLCMWVRLLHTSDSPVVFPASRPSSCQSRNALVVPLVLDPSNWDPLASAALVMRELGQEQAPVQALVDDHGRRTCHRALPSWCRLESSSTLQSRAP